MTHNPHEELARLQKAMDLADVCDVLGHTVETADLLSYEDWERLAQLALVSPPSALTQDKVIQILLRRKEAKERILKLKLALKIGKLKQQEDKVDQNHG